MLLAYRFPPAGNAIASRRPEGLYKHLPEFGWDPVVVTTQNTLNLPDVHAVADRSLAAKRGPVDALSGGNAGRKRGLKSGILQAAKVFARLHPLGYDAYARWSWDAAQKAIELGSKQPVHLIWATLSPLSLGPAAIRVARQLGVPCIFDLRDPPDEALGNLPRGWFTAGLRSASELTVAAPSCVTPYVAEHARQPLLVLSGAWEEDQILPQTTPQFRIVHAGTWHARYSIEPMFQALAELSGEIPGFADMVRAAFIGRGSQSIVQAPSYGAVAQMVEHHPLQPHEAVRDLLATASVLLIARSSSGYKAQAITGKIFEYASYSIPLLSIGGEDDLHAGLVRWLGGLWANDTMVVKEFLRTAYMRWKEKGISVAERDSTAIEYLSQRRMAAEMASVMHAVVEHRSMPLRAETPWPA